MNNGIMNDYYMDFVLNTGEDCFNKCIKDFSERDFSSSEEKCIQTCFSKNYLSLRYFINLSEASKIDSVNSK